MILITIIPIQTLIIIPILPLLLLLITIELKFTIKNYKQFHYVKFRVVNNVNIYRIYGIIIIKSLIKLTIITILVLFDGVLIPNHWVCNLFIIVNLVFY